MEKAERDKIQLFENFKTDCVQLFRDIKSRNPWELSMLLAMKNASFYNDQSC